MFTPHFFGMVNLLLYMYMYVCEQLHRTVTVSFIVVMVLSNVISTIAALQIQSVTNQLQLHQHHPLQRRMRIASQLL